VNQPIPEVGAYQTRPHFATQSLNESPKTHKSILTQVSAPLLPARAKQQWAKLKSLTRLVHFRETSSSSSAADTPMYEEKSVREKERMHKTPSLPQFTTIDIEGHNNGRVNDETVSLSHTPHDLLSLNRSVLEQKRRMFLRSDQLDPHCDDTLL
jgi:hypothetical protein